MQSPSFNIKKVMKTPVYLRTPWARPLITVYIEPSSFRNAFQKGSRYPALTVLTHTNFICPFYMAAFLCVSKFHFLEISRRRLIVRGIQLLLKRFRDPLLNVTRQIRFMCMYV